MWWEENVLQVIVAGLFCPGAYINRLIAHGIFQKENERAAVHLAILQQLDPDLNMPTLQINFDPATPEQEIEESPLKNSDTTIVWTADLHLFAATRQRVFDQYRVR